MLETIKSDVRYALRQAWKYRGSTLASFTTLTVGIGVTVGLFTLLSGILLRPLPIGDTDRVVKLTAVDLRTGDDLKVSMADFLDWKRRLQSISRFTLYRLGQGNVMGQDATERVRTIECDTGMLAVLGVTPIRGRNFSAGQDEPGRADEALLTYPYWRSRFGGRDDALGRKLVIDNKPYRVVGVLPDLLDTLGEENVWLPLSVDPNNELSKRGYHQFYALARLKSGVSVAQADSEIRSLAAALAREYPYENKYLGARIESLKTAVVGNFRIGLIVLFGFVLIVLFMACASVANLSLARAAAREREMSIRVALGAGKRQLLRQVLIDSLLLSTAATVAGSALGVALVRVVLRLPGLNIPLAQNITADWRALLVAIALAIATGLGFGSAPALQALLVNVNESLKQTGGRSSESRRHRNVSKWLVALQSLAAAALLVFSGLLLHSFLQAAKIDPGFSPDHLLGAYVSIPTARIDYDHPGRIGVFVQEALAQIRDTPGVESAAFASDLPLNPTAGQAGVLVEGKSELSALTAPTARGTLVSPGYFHTLGVPLIEGREFDNHDNTNSPTVIIVNQAFVREFLAGRDATMQRVALASDPKQFLSIVGVVGNVHQVNLEKPSEPQVYLSLNQQEHIWLAILARTRGNPMQVFVPIRRAIQKVDPEVAVFLPKPMEQIVQQQGSWRRFETALVASFAAFALFLAAFGTYSVISNVVSRRIPEIGIRMALGASPRDILREFILAGITPAILGGFVGILAALFAARLTASLLYGISPYDWFSYAIAAATILLVSAAASYVATRRVALLSPSRALRYE